jgi:ubiquinone/menaquinone biosynthesis C-methylase UbiE
MVHKPCPSKDNWIATREGYDRWACGYDDADASTLLDEPLIALLCRPLQGLRVLDLGCGTGRYLRLLKALGTRLVGVDLSYEMLHRAKRQDHVPSWLQARAGWLPFQKGVFDRVVSGLLIDHVNDLPGFFHSVVYVLTPAGRVVIAAVHPEMQRLTGPVVSFRDGADEYRISAVIHEVPALVGAARSAGLTLVERHEPRINANVVKRRPEWKNRFGCPAFVVLAFQKEPI